MTRTLFCLILLCGTGGAETVRVTVGDTGCPGRQTTVRESFEKIPGVSSVAVLPRQPGDPPARRTFVVASIGSPPAADALRTALGRRAKNFPILDYQKPAAQPAPPSK